MQQHISTSRSSPTSAPSRPARTAWRSRAPMGNASSFGWTERIDGLVVNHLCRLSSSSRSSRPPSGVSQSSDETSESVLELERPLDIFAASSFRPPSPSAPIIVRRALPKSKPAKPPQPSPKAASTHGDARCAPAPGGSARSQSPWGSTAPCLRGCLLRPSGVESRSVNRRAAKPIVDSSWKPTRSWTFEALPPLATKFSARP
mmetsp:Transcript_15268/g.53181  ORF Transcript_15268/g.53181 Transcript_15268/m.53181 type:complete len:203 (+) Transcript_15268:685-1293(+)